MTRLGMRRALRLVPVAAACAALGAFGAGSAAAQAPTFTFAKPGPLIQDIQKFWSQNMRKYYGRRFRFVPKNRILGATGQSSLNRLPCPEGLSWRTDVKDNAIGGECSTGYIVVWDATPAGILARIARNYGQAPVGMVFAHEFGHVVQAQLDINQSTIHMEQQADCFGGAYVAWNVQHGAVKLISSPGDIDQLFRGMLLVRDDPGTSAGDSGAHGSGFDRVRAFQDGYLRGIAACRAYRHKLPPLFETAFTANDIGTGGNLPYDQLLSDVTPAVNKYFTQTEPGFTDVTLADPAAVPPADGTCSTVIPLTTVCPATRTVYFDTAAVRSQHTNVGDAATAALLALTAADSAVPADVPAASRYLWDACRAGNFFRTEAAAGQLSAGDMDEVLSFLLHPAATIQPGDYARAALALRRGVFGGRDSCPAFIANPGI
ncbi:MAG: hypothetical protein U0Y82_02160 [Thermoleophilia bacterium]